MNKALIYVLISLFTVCVLTGCASVPKKVKEEVVNLQGRVDTLESRVEGVEVKQAELERAASEKSQAPEEVKYRTERTRTNISPKAKTPASRERVKEIQACLKKAGFYRGDVDGVKGRATIKAIREFQKSSGLRADGVVGPRTWEALSTYK